MKQIFIFLLLCYGYTACGVPKQDSMKVRIEGKEIYAIYTHGGELAEINEAFFEIENMLDSEIQLEFISLVHVLGKQDELGTINLEQTDTLNIKQLQLNQDKISINKAFLLQTHQPSNLVVNFSSISVSTSYHYNYQAIRLALRIDQQTIWVDAPLHIEREEPDDMDYED